MKIAIYGAGSLGTVLGAYIARSGQPVDLISRNLAHVDALQKKGAHITGAIEMLHPVTALVPQQMRGTYDLIFLMTKQQGNDSVPAFLRSFLAPNGVICTLQNGLPEASVAAAVGSSRTVGCTVAWGATLLSPGVAALTSDANHMSFDIGSFRSDADSKLPMVQEILELMCPAYIRSNFLGSRWSKLLINAAFSGTSAVFGCTFGEAAANTQSRALIQQIMKECLDVGHALGTRFEPVQGKNIALLMDYRNPLKKWIAGRLIPFAMRKHRNIRAGMLQDLEKGHLTEVDYINGAVSDNGRAAGVATPINDRIVAVVHGMEKGLYAPSFENFSLFAGARKNESGRCLF